jgi:peptidyl-prolyl cis-trans isomerase C
MKTPIAIVVSAAIAAGAAAAMPVPDSLYRLYAMREFDRAGQLLAQLVDAGRPADKFALSLEWGDFLLDKQADPAGAESVYRQLLDEFPRERSLPDVLYRLALAQELQEKYLEAAQNYEAVATRHMKSRFGSDALEAIERCFRKNYQERVAYVDSYPITRIEFDDRLGRYPSSYETYERKEFLLDTMIDNRLLYRAAIDAAVHERPEFISEYWDMRNRFVFEEWYAHHITANSDPTEREIKAQYSKDRDTKFTTPEKVHGWQLVVTRRELADSLRRLLLGSAAVPWETLATRFSIAQDRERSGDLGLFPRGMRDKAIEDAAFRLKPGQVSQPVRLDTAWALVRVTERTARTVRPYRDVRSQLEVQVRQDKANRLYEERSERLRQTAAVVIDTAALEEGRDILGVVDGVQLTTGQLHQRLEQIPAFFRAQFQTPEGMRRVLDQMVLEQLILTDAEANDDWLWNNAVNRILERRARMLVDHHVRLMTVDPVAIDTAEMKADYRATLDDFKVPAKARAREITAPTRARAELLRSWAREGRLPELLTGLALLVTDPGRLDIADALAATDDPDTLVARYGFTETPRAVLPGTPTQRIGNRLLPDLGLRCPLAGPFGSSGVYGLAFADRSRQDTIFRPAIVEARDGESLSALLGIEPQRSEDGTVLVDDGRLGTYVRLQDPLAAADYRGLFALAAGQTSGPITVGTDRLAVRLTRKDIPAAATFEDIARRFSTAASRHSGGDMSWFARDDKSRDARVVDAAHSLNPGAISPVLKINDSTWTFIKVEERQKAHVQPFDEVAPKIENKLRRQRTETLHHELIGALRADAAIEVLMTPAAFIFELPGDDLAPVSPASEPDVISPPK